MACAAPQSTRVDPAWNDLTIIFLRRREGWMGLHVQPFEGDGLESNAARLAEWRARGVLPPDGGGAGPEHPTSRGELQQPPASKVRALSQPLSGSGLPFHRGGEYIRIVVHFCQRQQGRQRRVRAAPYKPWSVAASLHTQATPRHAHRPSVPPIVFVPLRWREVSRDGWDSFNALGLQRSPAPRCQNSSWRKPFNHQKKASLVIQCASF